MKRRISIQIFIYFGLFLFITTGVFVIGHLGLVNNSLKDKAIIEVASDLKVVSEGLELRISQLESDTLYLGKDITYLYERPIYLIQDFLKKHQGVKAIYLYDNTATEIGDFKEDDGYDTIVSNIVKDQFFYSPIIWTEIDRGLYCISHKITGGDTYIVAYVLDLPLYLRDFTENDSLQASLFNTYGQVVASTANGSTEDLSDQSYKNELLNGHEKNIIQENHFIAFKGLELDGLDLYLYLQTSTQIYRGIMRLYYIRILSIILLLMTLGGLMAWRLMNKLYGLIVVEALATGHQAYEFKRIKEELKRAIYWIDDVVMHYDELNELKEELVELNDRLPKEDDSHAKKTKTK